MTLNPEQSGGWVVVSVAASPLVTKRVSLELRGVPTLGLSQLGALLDERSTYCRMHAQVLGYLVHVACSQAASQVPALDFDWTALYTCHRCP